MLGNRITPIDQNCSKQVVIIVLGLPDVMSETVQRLTIDTLSVISFSLLNRFNKFNSLQIICPAVYIWQQQIADKQRKKTCNSYEYTKPVMFPQKI